MKAFTALYFFAILASAHAADPLEVDQWYLRYDSNNFGANIENAWKVVKDNYVPIIAVIDAGFDVEHEDFKESILINENEIPNNGIDDDNNGFIDDYYGYNSDKKNGTLTGKYDFETKHGTAISGIISAKHDNGIGIKGVTGGFKIIPIVKPEPMAKRPQKLPHLIEAFRYAVARGADIINFSSRLKVTSPAFKDLMRELYEKGIIVVATAGNVGIENSKNRFPGAYAEEFSNIIVVGSSDRNGMRAKSSNYGSESVHLFAPGSKMMTTHPTTQGSATYGTSSGTSFAAPVVAGIAALVLATHGPESRWTMRERLIESCNQFEHLKGQARSGGIIDAYNALTAQ